MTQARVSEVGTATSPDGIQILYEMRGRGAPALILVHGWSCDRSYWAAQLEPFARDFTVVAVDLGGHGESGLGRDSWSMQSFGGDVAAVVEKLGFDRVILVGHSLGGDVIVEAARRLPGRVAGLVWVDAYKQLRTPRTAEQIQEMLAPFRGDFAETTRGFVRGMFPADADPSLVDRVAMDMSAAPREVALSALEHAISFDRAMPGALRDLGLPVIAINPDNRPTDVESMEQNGVKVMLMPGVGHFPMMEDPARFNALLRTAIDELARARSAR